MTIPIEILIIFGVIIFNSVIQTIVKLLLKIETPKIPMKSIQYWQVTFYESGTAFIGWLIISYMWGNPWR